MGWPCLLKEIRHSFISRDSRDRLLAEVCAPRHPVASNLFVRDGRMSPTQIAGFTVQFATNRILLTAVAVWSLRGVENKNTPT